MINVKRHVKKETVEIEIDMLEKEKVALRSENDNQFEASIED